MQSSDYGWGILFPIPDRDLKTHMLSCAKGGREREKKRKRERAFGEDSQPTAQNMTSSRPTLDIMEG